VLGGGSIQLARVFGIRIGVDLSWFVVLFLIIWSLSDSYQDVLPGEDNPAFALAVVSALLFFLSIVLHELGHALVAMRNGIGIAGIDLWLFGGIAKMKREADSAGVEFRIAAAGPAVTLVIVAVCVGLGVLASGWSDFRDAIGLDPDNAFEAVLGFLAYVNAALLVFNLIPGFPLDGGRIARAIVWWRTGDRARATTVAARLGRGFAYLLMGVGVFWLLQGVLIAGVWMLFIGMFLNQAARSAEVQTQITSRIEGLRVLDVMDAEPVSVPQHAKLDLVLEDYFLRYGWPWFPVTDAASRFVGHVTRAQVEEVPEALRPGWTVDEVMTRDAGSVNVEEPLETLLGSESLARLGAIMAVDRDGVLRGVVTVDQVRRALRPAL
jgi:Zn-dependent protease